MIKSNNYVREKIQHKKHLTEKIHRFDNPDPYQQSKINVVFQEYTQKSSRNKTSGKEKKRKKVFKENKRSILQKQVITKSFCIQ